MHPSIIMTICPREESSHAYDTMQTITACITSFKSIPLTNSFSLEGDLLTNNNYMIQLAFFFGT